MNKCHIVPTEDTSIVNLADGDIGIVTQWFIKSKIKGKAIQRVGDDIITLGEPSTSMFRIWNIGELHKCRVKRVKIAKILPFFKKK